MRQTSETYRLRQIIRQLLSLKGMMRIMEIVDELQKIGITMQYGEARYVIESTSPFSEVFSRRKDGNKVYYELSDDSDIDFY